MSKRSTLTCVNIAVCCAATLLSGCGGIGALSQGFSSADGPADVSLTSKSVTTTSSTSSGYTLTAEEAELDCKKLAGKVQLRILEVRSRMTPEESSTLARSIQGANAMFGGSKAGMDATGDRARQVAQLQAYNNQLANKNCRSFDIPKALSGDETVPSPTVPPKTAAR